MLYGTLAPCQTIPVNDSREPVHLDHREHGDRFQAGQHQDVAARVRICKPGDSQQRDDRAVMRQRVHL